MPDHALIRRLSEAFGPSGHEQEVREIFLDEVDGLGRAQADAHGSVVIELAAAETVKEVPPRVMLGAHMDEVGFLVQSLNVDGSLQVFALGSWWTHTLLSQRFTLRTRSGKELLAIVVACSPHALAGSQREKVLPLERILFDIGASSRGELEQLGIRIGDVLVPFSPYQPLQVAHRFVGKALDNRLGMAQLIECARRLHERPAPNHTLLTATVQEEVGARGAMTATVLAAPEVAIVLECSPADDMPLFEPSSAQSRLGYGTQVRLIDPSAISSTRLVDLCLEIASREKIPFQCAVRRSGGTDAKSIHLADRGVPTIVLSTPARSIHSHNSIFDERDYVATLDLAEQLLRCLDRATVDALKDFLGDRTKKKSADRGKKG